MVKFYSVEISAESQDQADRILDALLAKRLVTGGQFIRTPARFLWKGDVVNMDYLTVTSFTVEKHKNKIIEIAEEISEETVPMVRFTLMEGNQKLMDWIEETVA